MSSKFVLAIKRYVYNWARPEMNDIEVQNSVSNSKCVGNESAMNEYERYFVRLNNNSSWLGEKQTLDCLKKVMSSIDRYPYHVVKGRVQSGKSLLLIYYSAWMAHKYDMNVVIMLRNQKADVKSLLSKFRRFKGEKCIRNLEVIKFSAMFDTNEMDDLIDKFCESQKVFVILGNSDQIGKINQVVDAATRTGAKLTPFTMCIDELDLNEKGVYTRFQQEFEKLKESGYISHILGVTGTALPVLFKRVGELQTEQVISLDAPVNHKNIHNITFTDIDINDDDIVEKTMIRMLKTSYAFYDKDGNKHPVILLIKDDRIKENQMQMMQKLTSNQDIQKKWAVIVFNGDGIFVSLPGGRTVDSTPKCINSCFQLLKEKYAEHLDYIAVISGDMANRGLSFVSEDYAWHLTHMILCARTSCSGSNLVQYVRLCGCFNDDIPLEMFTSNEIQRELFAYDALQERCVEHCEDPLMDTEQLDERLRKMKLDATCVVRRPIDTKMKVKYKNLSNYDKIMCGTRIEAQSMKKAAEMVMKEYGKKPVVLVKKIKFKCPQTSENIKKIKQYLADKYGIEKYVNVIDNSRYIHLYKNPFFVTDTYARSMAMISKNGNQETDVYVKSMVKDNVQYGQLFLFETPIGIFLSDNIEKSEIEKMFMTYSIIV